MKLFARLLRLNNVDSIFMIAHKFMKAGISYEKFFKNNHRVTSS